MTNIFDTAHLHVLKQSLTDSKPWRGQNARNWYGYIDTDASELLNHSFVRRDFLDHERIDKLSDKELSISILSWGGMNRRHGLALFKNQEWLEIVDLIRTGKLNRRDAFSAFSNLREHKILPGMGPAYYTKLICFLNRDLNGYIMDQWSSKSLNLLLDKPLVRLTSSGQVKDSNTADTYEEFCKGIESLAELIGKSPLDTEEAMFSYGGRKKGLWRRYVVQHFPKASSKSVKVPNKKRTSKESKIKINTTAMERINYNDALNFFNEHNTTMPTLGRRSDIHIRRDGDLLYLTNSSKNQYPINRNIWDKVMTRMAGLPLDHRATSKYYTMGDREHNWKDCPNKVLAVYIPAIVRFITIQQNN